MNSGSAPDWRRKRTCSAGKNGEKFGDEINYRFFFLPCAADLVGFDIDRPSGAFDLRDIAGASSVGCCEVSEPMCSECARVRSNIICLGLMSSGVRVVITLSIYGAVSRCRVLGGRSGSSENGRHAAGPRTILRFFRGYLADPLWSWQDTTVTDRGMWVAENYSPFHRLDS
jgi:hypothetical protein